MLTLISLHEKAKYPSHDKWLCRCECGREQIAQISHVKSEHTKYCKVCASKKRAAGQSKTTSHRLNENHFLYPTWRAMRERCNSPKHKSYPNYGGRGIKVCERWNNFELFVSDVGEPPTLQHTLDRIDNNGNYEPLNIRWATPTEQQANRRKAYV